MTIAWRAYDCLPCDPREEWEWLKRLSARHKAAGGPGSGSEGEAGEAEAGGEQEPEEVAPSEQQRAFTRLVAATARRLLSYMEVSQEDALSHR